MQRVEEAEVIDGVTSANIDMLSGQPDQTITDFNLSFKRDIILCKFTLSVLSLYYSKTNIDLTFT